VSDTGGFEVPVVPVPLLAYTGISVESISSKPLGIVYIFIAGNPTVNGLAQAVGQVLSNKITKAQTFIRLAHQNQATIAGNT
jgi:hypothetical protein